jgi:hypothetical protein
VAVAKGVELLIATTHIKRGVRNGNNNTNNNGVGGLRV